MQAPDGSWQQVTGAEAVKRAQSFTARIGSEADVQDYAKREEFRGAGNMALAAGSGVVDSLLLGFGDAAVAKLGGERARQFLEDADRYAPGSRMAGQGVGFLAPMLVSGGTAAGVSAAGKGAQAASMAGRAARVATALPRGLTAVAEGAGSVAARAVGGGLPGRFVAPVVSQGIELGVYGAGQGASRAIVRDPNADGEAVAAAMGQGFLHGAGMGAGFGAGFGLLGMAGAKAGQVASRTAERVGGAIRSRVGEFVDTTAARVRGVEEGLRAGQLPERVEQLATRGLDEATALAERVTGRTAPDAVGLAGKADRLARTVVDVDKMAVEKALQSTGAKSKTLGEAEKLGALKATAARQIVEELPRLAGKEGKVLTFAEQAEAAVLLKRQVGERMGEALERLDATGASISVSAVAKKARREVVDELKKIAGAEGYAARVEDYLASLEGKATQGRMPLGEFHKNRAFLDDMVFEAAASRSPARKALEKVRGIMESSFESSATRAAKAAGSDAATAYKAAKADYRSAVWVEKAAKEGAKRTDANRALGFSEQVGALTGAVLGGGGVTGLVTSVAAAAANRAVKQVGDQATAAILREMQMGKPLAEAVADVTRRNIGDKTKQFFTLAEPVRKKASEAVGRVRERALTRGREVVAAAGETARTVGRGVARGARVTAQATGRGAEAAAMAADYDRRRKEALAARTGGATKVAETARRIEAVGAPPEVAAVAAETAQRGAVFLASRLPPVPQRVQTLQPDLATDTPDPEAMASWLRMAKVIESPMSALDSLAAGTLDAGEVEALREVYPTVYQQIRDQVALEIQDLSDRGERLPYSKALALGTLLDVVADPTLDPAFIAAMQTPAQPAAPPVAPSRRAVSRAPGLYSLNQESPRP